MAKKSAAKVKMLAAEAKRSAAERRAEKKASLESANSNSDLDLDRHQAQGEYWRELGLGAPAIRALVDDGLFELADLRKISLAAAKELEGMTPNAIRILVDKLKKSDLSFRK
jgi:hypothetical protein